MKKKHCCCCCRLGTGVSVIFAFDLIALLFHIASFVVIYLKKDEIILSYIRNEVYQSLLL